MSVLSNQNRKIFVAGIDTGIGKTIISALICEALKSDYWKPIQAGTVEPTDTDIIKSLVGNSKSVFHPESYLLNMPASPNIAAKAEGIEIKKEKIIIPKVNNHLVIEGAGGLMVPLANDYFIIDLIDQFNAECILVVKPYLGSINHTLLSIELLKKRNVKILGLFFNGDSDSEVENTILTISGLKCVGRCDYQSIIDKGVIKRLSENLLLP